MHEYSGEPDKYPKGPFNGHGPKIVWITLLTLSVLMVLGLSYLESNLNSDKAKTFVKPVPQFQKKELVTSKVDKKTGQIVEVFCNMGDEECYYWVRFATEKGFGRFTMNEFELRKSYHPD